MLSHRLGLIPIKVDPRLFQYKKEQDDYNERNSLKFKLKVKCERQPKYKDAKLDIIMDNPEEYLTNTSGICFIVSVWVYASDLVWVPQGMQQETFKSVAAVYPKILIAKLRENQEIQIEVICEKGIGK